MNKELHEQIWPLLRHGFSEIEELVAQEIPLVKGGADYWNNPTVPMFAYGTCTLGNTVVVLSFQVGNSSEQMHVVGDICLEEGKVLAELIDVRIDKTDEAVECAKLFIAKCKEQAGMIVSQLRS